MYDIVGQSLCWCDYNTNGSFSGWKSSGVCIWMCIVFKENKGRNSEGCWFSVASCSTAENILTIKDCRNKFKLYWVQAIHVGIISLRMVCIVSRPIGSCQQAPVAIFVDSVHPRSKCNWALRRISFKSHWMSRRLHNNFLTWFKGCDMKQTTYTHEPYKSTKFTCIMVCLQDTIFKLWWTNNWTFSATWLKWWRVVSSGAAGVFWGIQLKLS